MKQEDYDRLLSSGFQQDYDGQTSEESFDIF